MESMTYTLSRVSALAEDLNNDAPRVRVAQNRTDGDVIQTFAFVFVV